MFTKEELIAIAQILSNISYKAGQGDMLKMAEGIIKKCTTMIENPDDRKKKE